MRPIIIFATCCERNGAIDCMQQSMIWWEALNVIQKEYANFIMFASLLAFPLVHEIDMLISQ